MNHELSAITFAKGHGTENDFVILPDEKAELTLDASLVAALCDRRAGIGGDGLLRVAQVGALLDAGVVDQVDPALSRTDWFMDYYNADGSIAEMCGNGTRVFAHWVYSRGLVGEAEFLVGTRAGAKKVTVSEADQYRATVSVEMGEAAVTGVSSCFVGESKFAGMGVDMGNPHLACVVPGLDAESLAALDLVKPRFDEEFFPQGVNVEILTELSDGTVDMRVYERGVGETRSCGTGTVAAARAALADAGQVDGTVRVRIPGGEVEVTIAGEESTLTGPSRIVAEGTAWF
ncbi:diaminopimelate epimerase [Corynebacterium vitaeruminis]|uniref:Diaminopimelate epimerase n=1 Tax=Corynebacterium vitaeruminis DSM 20294 TaxID=1224164 RepID=W5Y1C7_9CORY|nr:diaminopimelate epimerase [Corynebacterium vitaeruminis]AHI22997.1 diaminopimelate epimerase [Corynebacterium vitaeruminis DSM 20294]